MNKFMINEIKGSLSENLIGDRKPPRILVKFGKEEHLKMLREGKLYLNPWSYFKTCGKHGERTDEKEGTHLWINPSKARILIAGRTLSRENGALNGAMSFVDRKTKIFCAAALWNGDEIETDEVFDHRIKDLGDSFLAIVNIKNFFEKLKHALQKKYADGIIERSDARRVSYFDEMSYNGVVGPFGKSLKYAHQREWRLVIQTAQESDNPFELDIGSIERISMLSKTKDFKNVANRNDESFLNLLF